MKCPYCGGDVAKVNGQVIYPHRRDLYHKVFYQCRPCDAYVGCHGDTDKPMGRLANRELRSCKLAAHNVFDKLWRDGGMTRSAAYAWLANSMELTSKECHIGMFDVDQCRKVVSMCEGR